MKKSKFAYLFNNDNNFFVVQTNTKKMFEITKEVYNALAIDDINLLKKDDVYQLFIDSEILVPINVDEVEKLLRQCEKVDDDKEWHSLHIIPTSKCNLGCEYCFVLKDMDKNKCHADLDDDTLLKGLELFFKDNPSKKLTVTFYGGEPLVKPQIIYDTIDYINKNVKAEVNKKIITNGTLVTPKIAKFLYDNEFDVNISIDGNEKSHNKFRVYKDFRSSYADTIRGYNYLKEAGNSIKILMTVGDFNIDYLEECVESLLDLEPTSIALNLPKKLQTKDNNIENDLNFNKLLEKYFKCVDMCYKRGIPEAHFADILYGFLSDNVQYRPCYGCGKQIALSPYKKIGPCQAYLSTGKYFIDIDQVSDKSDLRKTKEFKKWKDITMFNCTKCCNCYLQPVCPGDCPFDWENRMGSFENPPESYCVTRRAMFDYLVKRLIENKKILFREVDNETQKVS